MLTTKIPKMAYHYQQIKRFSNLTAGSSKILLNTKVINTHHKLVSAEKKFLQFSTSMHWNCIRNFHKPEYEDPPSPAKAIQKIIPHSAMGVRLANENGYLSWCRNAYLSTGVAVMMTNVGITMPGNLLLHYAVSGALIVSILNLVLGTASYTVQLIALKQSVGMSLFTTLLHMSFAIIHLCVWLLVIFLFHSYPENDLVVIELEKQDEENEN